MLISHEVPLELLSNSLNFNDYDYCLLHLTYESEEYKQFYTDRNWERSLLLDNSLFELGDALTNDQLAEGVLSFMPTWYVVPDCLNNKDTTIERFSNFIKDYGDLPGRKIGVAQGSTRGELLDCYRYMSEHADKIAIPFDSKAFGDNLASWCYGRQEFIQYLVDNNYWNNKKPHHLLGCSLAREFANPLYRQISIESIDTSNPVVAGIAGLKYGEDGLDCKPGIKLCELINAHLSSEALELIAKNVQQFRKICDGNISL